MSEHPRAVAIHDVTLSLGETAPGVRFETPHAIEIASLLARLGAEHVEVARAGEPHTLERVRAVATALEAELGPGGPRLGVRARCVAEEIAAALGAGAHFVNLAGGPGDAAAVRKAVAQVIAGGAAAVFTVEEDTRPGAPATTASAAAAVEAGATRVVWSDTLGLATPELVGERVRQLRKALPSATVAVELHDDRGLATANALAALAAGARSVITSVNGLGPRSGLTDLAVLVANLLYTQAWQPEPGVLIKELSVRVASYGRAFVDFRRPVVGRYALDPAGAFVSPVQVGREPPPPEGRALPSDRSKLFLMPFVKSATELRYHRHGPGLRFVMIDERLVSDCRQYCIVREIPLVEAPAPHVDTHVHTCDSLFMFLGLEEGMTGLKVEVSLGETAQELESPAAVFIPAGTPHTYRIIRGRGYYINHVLSGNYNESLLDPLKPPTA